ncbi:hypothetical protein BHE74_00040318 [Ensete ventricosum]|nr:hypothetical protein BHE74_00040318 [Ensete ventricosum]
MAVEVGVSFKPVRTESPLELVGNESSLELVETESPLKLVGTELPLELIGTESPLELVRTESPLELIGTESPLELRVVSCHLFITCVVPNCHLALSRVSSVRSMKRPSGVAKAMSLKPQVIGHPLYSPRVALVSSSLGGVTQVYSKVLNTLMIMQSCYNSDSTMMVHWLAEVWECFYIPVGVPSWMALGC